MKKLAKAEKTRKKPYFGYRTYGAAVSWLLKAFPLGEYESKKGEFRREREIYHPVIEAVAKHELIAALAGNALERKALNDLFNRIHARAGMEKLLSREKEEVLSEKILSEREKILDEFVKKIGVEKSKALFSAQASVKVARDKADLMDRIGDEKLLTRRAFKLGEKYGLKPGKSFVRHLYVQGLTPWYGFFESLAELFKSKYA